MQIALTEKFIEDLVGLQTNLQHKCQQIVSSMKEISPQKIYSKSLPGWRLHKLQSSPFISLSLDMNYRILCKIDGERIFYHRIVKHSLADAPRINRNDNAETPYFYDEIKMEPLDIFPALLSLGFTEELISIFKGATTEEDLMEALITVDKEIAEHALNLYETNGIIIPRTKYMLLHNDADLDIILKKSLREWEIYLHPSQRYVVSLPVNNRLLVCGSAGTGKTVCAWYRLQYLAMQNQSVGFVVPNKSILDVSRQTLEVLLNNIQTDCYFLIPNSVEELIELAKTVKHIIIDEGQELTPVWYKALGIALLNESTGITIFYDLNQLGANYSTGDTGRYTHRLSSWNEGIDSISNCSKMNLYINYRNSREIAEFYTAVLQNALPKPIDLEMPVFSTGDVIDYTIRDISHATTTIIEIVRKLETFYDYGEIGIICFPNTIQHKELCHKLELVKIPAMLEVQSKNKISVTSPRRIWGYEKKAIIIILSTVDYMTKDIGKAINSYIALSRARDRLFVIRLGD